MKAGRSVFAGILPCGALIAHSGRMLGGCGRATYGFILPGVQKRLHCSDGDILSRVTSDLDAVRMVLERLCPAAEAKADSKGTKTPGLAEKSTADATREAAVRGLLELPDLLEQHLPEMRETAKRLARIYSEARSFFYLGRGLCFPLALEGALKLKEISYIHAEGYAAGEMKHGPIALIDETVPVIVIAPSDHLFEKTASNVQEALARDPLQPQLASRLARLQLERGDSRGAAETLGKAAGVAANDAEYRALHAAVLQRLTFTRRSRRPRGRAWRGCRRRR